MTSSKSGQVLTLLYQDANKMFYDIDGQINNLYSMHTRAAASSHSHSTQGVKEMTSSDVELVRDRIALLKDKTESLASTFRQTEALEPLTAEKQTFWRKRIEQLNLNVERLPSNLDRAQRNFQRQRKESQAYNRKDGAGGVSDLFCPHCRRLTRVTSSP